MQDFRTLKEFIREFDQRYTQGDFGLPAEERADASTAETKIVLTMPLLIRIMEYSHEDAQSDVDLHVVAENIEKMMESQRCLTMDDYALIVPAIAAGTPAPSDVSSKEEEIEESIKATIRKHLKHVRS